MTDLYFIGLGLAVSVTIFIDMWLKLHRTNQLVAKLASPPLCSCCGKPVVEPPPVCVECSLKRRPTTPPNGVALAALEQYRRDKELSTDVPRLDIPPTDMLGNPVSGRTAEWLEREACVEVSPTGTPNKDAPSNEVSSRNENGEGVLVSDLYSRLVAEQVHKGNYKEFSPMDLNATASYRDHTGAVNIGAEPTEGDSTVGEGLGDGCAGE